MVAIKTHCLKLFPAILLGLAITACGPEGTETEDETTDTVEVEIITGDEDDDFTFILPSALQIASIFKRSGLTYAGGITNSIDNVTSYSSNLSKSLNFGVYSADLSYCVLNNQAQESLKYLKVVKQLSYELGMDNIFSSERLFESFEKNIGNEDSTIYILTVVQEQVDDYLQENEQEYEGPVFFTGAWIEGMYIGSRVARDQNNSNLAMRIVEQMTILDNLVKGLERYPRKTDELETLIADLKSVKEIYLSFSAIKGMEEYDIDFETISVSEEEIDKMATKIEKIRTNIING